MKVDYHIHTARCGHASGRMEEYVEAALARGFAEIGFADHLPMYWLPEAKRDPEIAMTFAQLPGYVAEVKQLQQKYPGISIRLGIEADYLPGCKPRLLQALAGYDWDYIIGSVHFLDDWGFDDPRQLEEYNRRDPEQYWEEYYRLIQESALAGVFDIIGHADLIKKFDPPRPSQLYRLYDETVAILAQCQVAVEINTAGWRVPAREQFPDADFLARCARAGVPVTFGSDAHKPEQVGYNWDKAIDLLKAVGYREIAFFKSRKIFLQPL
ncbi:histidinol-phosphate phosphatase [Carboxydocella sporoproducens DSM 16521]|uniref:Histidinol-phosphatase n=2 Tax=Carboxydocella TaxID=178898 RepID=A0A1T4M4C7_9FIRM|nr:MULTISPECIES: histidinol-phosphatase HisJ family protein [Carboxydocella]AVX21046.1 histidinol-phosphate phosphatase [Carboxydocella thermautotrophica]AVX31466.1 histidinol-phosphate phosphatase [Carboxydocella thermautotrophica]SJZ61850.1 histidinol-phosphate phosphatase [Carboxydocella sporoproducens DSM 16521]